MKRNFDNVQYLLFILKLIPFPFLNIILNVLLIIFKYCPIFYNKINFFLFTIELILIDP